ncbi:hypothetical protein [Clostridium ganghwense]|uniref:Phospholipid scramblase n=1 Tax=Clostridium ganghwense TaxID=312089 RepID=A0ABT4CK86_9CLOT|nr:hypothetical protein [Clostridium ganghwense]MCY6369333.1 hypothetical protein [Clostridium ganghwense]
MFMRTPEMYNQIPMCSRFPMFHQIPMMPMIDSEIPVDEPRQVPPKTQPTPPGTTGGPDFQIQPGPPVQEIQYTQGWLRTQIGKYMKFEFLIGTNFLIDREGILVEVGVSYIVIKEAGTNDTLMCDLYSIKFARVYDNQQKGHCVK